MNMAVARAQVPPAIICTVGIGSRFLLTHKSRVPTPLFYEQQSANFLDICTELALKGILQLP